MSAAPTQGMPAASIERGTESTGRMSTAPVQDRGFHLFVYGTLRAGGAAAGMLEGCTLLQPASIAGTLYDIDGEFPALMLYGETPVSGEVWHVPDAARLQKLDEYEGVHQGLFRRIGLEVAGLPCWTYVAGPALAHRLTPERRMRGAPQAAVEDARNLG